jgi:hypothetical protein
MSQAFAISEVAKLAARNTAGLMEGFYFMRIV